MMTFTKDELISSTILARNFGDVLNKLKKNSLDKVAVIRNNNIEAVLLTIEEFEKLNDIIEQIEIYNLIKNRENNSDGFVEYNSILKEYGIDEKQL
jgi:PHD/YefM family antitoxin component YafN of YafNO toxin-antitoxin module